MFVVSVGYVSSLDEVDLLLEDHVNFLKKQYEKGIFIVSGRKVPRTGGVILAKAKSKKELEGILHQDPFYIKGIADYQITEFVASMTLPELSDLCEI